jgi:hypothetical protein
VRRKPAVFDPSEAPCDAGHLFDAVQHVVGVLAVLLLLQLLECSDALVAELGVPRVSALELRLVVDGRPVVRFRAALLDVLLGEPGGAL